MHTIATTTLPALTTDVLVIGSGAAGLTAAIAAARNGASTLLVESAGFLGGLSATLPWLGFHDRDYRQVVKGLPAEFVHRLQQARAASPYEYDIKCASAVSIDTHRWKCLAMQLCAEAGVKLMLHTHFLDTLRDGDRVTGVLVHHKSGLQRIHARTTIDCTGDGDVAARAGVPWEKGRTGDGLVQAPTLVFRLGGGDRSAFIDGCKREELNYREWLAPYPELRAKTLARLDRMQVIICGGFAPLLAQARAAGDLDLPQTRIVGVKTHIPDEFTVVMTRVLGLDPVDVHSVTAAYARVYEQIPPLVSFFQKYVPGFASARLLEIAPMLGIRESRRITGDYLLTENDLLNGCVFNDAIAMGAYHIDIHRPAGTWVESRNVRAYTIPLRSLIARGVDGLMMAGKCISAAHEAVASTRVIPICMAQGQAAGTAAAIAARRRASIRQTPLTELQTLLQQQGAEIGRTLEPPNQTLIDEIGQLPFDEPHTTGDRDAASSASLAWLQR
ncbi:FAD-dependent oxidoreductase [Geminisphaera colitermitum]|uniref:FAD-dependent oxidoreductase n=1 Tax=Geminisphaera colitermitum TaxID=1148786 RepID=UPI00019655E1|nr:FAD-dependent oxidoreductase [Geminisphaera colitermitum]